LGRADDYSLTGLRDQQRLMFGIGCSAFVRDLLRQSEIKDLYVSAFIDGDV
jgi:hypothetical protein